MHFLRPLAVVFPFAGLAHAKEDPKYQTNIVEGWTVLVGEALILKEGAATAKALDLLRGQLKEIVRTAPGWGGGQVA